MAVFWHFFCFYGMCITAGSRNRFVDHHTQYGMETLRGPFLFFVRSFAVSVPEMPMRACPHKRLDKYASEKGEKKERWNGK